MKYIDMDERRGEVSARFDRYFEYLRSVQHQFSSDLYAYASKLEHYSLDGKSSLHDSWLMTARFSYREKELTLEFLGAWHDRKLVLKYLGVKTYMFDLNVQFRNGDGDVLVHEFRIEDEFVTHEIAFHQGKSILITAQNVIPSTEMLEAPLPKG
jgi:hypothetical protein